MKILYTLGMVICITAFSPANSPQIRSSIVVGKLVNGGNGKPVEKALVYIIKGEEESLSGADGRFGVKTWQSYPLQLRISHPNFRDTLISISASSGSTSILLHPRN